MYVCLRVFMCDVTDYCSNMGNTYKDMLRTDEAISCYKKAIEVTSYSYTFIIFVPYHPIDNSLISSYSYLLLALSFFLLILRTLSPIDILQLTLLPSKLSLVTSFNMPFSNFIAPLKHGIVLRLVSFFICKSTVYCVYPVLLYHTPLQFHKRLHYILHFTSLHFSSLHFSFLHFTSLLFPSLLFSFLLFCVLDKAW